MRGATKITLTLVAVLLVSTTAFAGKKDRELSVQIEGDDGNTLSFSISGNVVEGLLEGLAGSDVECDVSTDEDTLAMLQHLDRHGEGSNYRFRDDDGKLVKASRRRGQLDLDIVRRGEKDAHVTLPWALAECMLGHRVELTHNATAEFGVEDEGAIRIKIE